MPSAAGGDPVDAARRAIGAIRAGKRPPLALLCGGDDFLRGRLGHDLAEALLPEAERTPFNFNAVEGDAASIPDLLVSLNTYSLFGGPTIVWMDGTRLLTSKSNVDELLERAASGWNDARRSDDEAARARAARDLLRGLALRGLDLSSLDAAAIETLGAGGEGVDVAFVHEVAAYCRDRGLSHDEAGGEAALLAALEVGWPEGNTLVLVAAACDRRLRLYKALQKHGLVLDLGGEERDPRAAEALARGRLTRIAADSGAKLTPGARELLERKVGFDLGRLHSELEKLQTYAGAGASIDEAAVEAAVGWTREEGQWDLANAIQERDLPRALRAVRRTLDQGAPPVKLFFQVASKVRDLALAQALLAGPLREAWRGGADDRAYRERVRPRIDALLAAHGDEAWAAFLKGHPYALFKSLEAAGRYRPEEVAAALEATYDANWALVSGGGDPAATLEHLVARVVSPRPRPTPARR
jgi:DNA polymerase-3 subunit delta